MIFLVLLVLLVLAVLVLLKDNPGNCILLPWFHPSQITPERNFSTKLCTYLRPDIPLAGLLWPYRMFQKVQEVILGAAPPTNSWMWAWGRVDHGLTRWPINYEKQATKSPGRYLCFMLHIIQHSLPLHAMKMLELNDIFREFNEQIWIEGCSSKLGWLCCSVFSLSQVFSPSKRAPVQPTIETSSGPREREPN